MGGCNLYPVKDGKPSILYKELLEKTGGNRKLTNFLYALAVQPDVVKLFAHSDLTSQGEPTSKAIIEKFNVHDIINDALNASAEAKAAGFADKKGNRVLFDEPNAILQSVYDFNDNHDTLKATIKYTEGGYYVEVEGIDAYNFNVNNSLGIREAIFNSLMLKLSVAGLNTVLSTEALAHFNVVNIRYQIKALRELGASTESLNQDKALLISELFADEPLVERIKDQFGDDFAQAISQGSGWHYGNDSLDMTPNLINQVKSLLQIVQRKMKKTLDNDDVLEIIADAEAEFAREDTYMNSNGLDIQQTLKELYKKYSLDLDNLDLLSKRVSSISEAADKLFLIKLKRMQEQQLKGVDTSKETKKLKKLQKDLDNARYLDSIATMLEQIEGSIGNTYREYKRLLKQLDRNPESLPAIQDYSEYIIRQLDLVNSYKDILDLLHTTEILEQDDLASEALAEDIEKAAKELRSTLVELENNARLKQTEVVHAFLKIYWGEDTEEAKKARGSDTTLSLIMETASHDIGLLDRFIYAAGTCSDEMMALVAEAVKKAKDKRDAKLRESLREVRSITEELYKSGSDTKFMFVNDKDGYPTGIISDYDMTKYYEDLHAYRVSLQNDPDVNDYDIQEMVNEWKSKHTKSVKLFGINVRVPFLKLNGVNIYAAKQTVLQRLTPTLYKYYQTMMQMKADMLKEIDAASNDRLFSVIEISSDMTTAVAEAGGNPAKVFEMIKNKVKDATIDREDDTDYSLSKSSILKANGLKDVHINAQGELILTVPLHYTTRIKDRSRVSTDFSKSMMAYLATSTEYIEMNKIVDALMLTKDYMLHRNVAQTEGDSALASVSKFGKKTYVALATKMGLATDLGGLADDFFERNVFGKAKANEGYLWGTKLRVDKLADALTGYTSMAGLTTNFLGAQANLLVGKLQMLIESGVGLGGEFFNMKDMAYADAKYFLMLAPLLNEINTQKKSSLLGLMMEYFDVKEDFYDQIKESGFYKQPISKIIGNKNLFFMYGMGEHLLHAEGMIAVLHNKNNTVLDDKGKKHPLMDAFYVEKDSNGVGTLKIKEGWTREDGLAIDEEYLDKIKGKIQYVNKSMHGAFGSLDKGMIHRYAFGRLIMNFRQWMPAHYSRRFRGRHYDTDLHEYREGYYVSTYKFLKGVVADLRHSKFQIAARWKELDEGQRYNIRRAVAETAILMALTALLSLIGPAKDHKGNWAARMLIYELSRMQMETAASNPLALHGFVDNMLKIVQSPMACVNTIEKLTSLLKLQELGETIESGKYEGRNKYSRTVEKALPFYGQINKMLDMGEENDLFLLFN